MKLNRVQLRGHYSDEAARSEDLWSSLLSRPGYDHLANLEMSVFLWSVPSSLVYRGRDLTVDEKVHVPLDVFEVLFIIEQCSLIKIIKFC